MLVGIIDTGIDGHHPDITPNFNAALSRNFTTDIEDIDGPCADEPDASCEDPADVDEDGHGTHVAGTVGSPLNGVGIAGVAPNVTLVNLRAGQDSGFFFLAATVDALTYAGRNGIDVVNMSFFIDPWLFNCAANPADSPEEQAEQRTIIEATQRAVRFARRHGVTLVVGARQRGHRPGQPDDRRDQPGLPDRHREDPDRRQQLPRHADRGGGRRSPSAPSGRAARRRTTPTTAPSRRTSPLRAVTSATSSGRRRTACPRTSSSPRTRQLVAIANGEADPTTGAVARHRS